MTAFQPYEFTSFIVFSFRYSQVTIKENISQLNICTKFTNIKLYSLVKIMQYIFLNLLNYLVV